jgi:iron complex transport system ATP-binding protein
VRNIVKLRILGVDVYYDSYKALSNIEFEACPGEFIALLGPNGSGKTTLLKTIARVLKPRRGVIYIDGRRADELSDNEYAKIVGFLPSSDISAIVRVPMKVVEVVAIGRKPYVTWSLTKTDLEKIWSAMKITGVEAFAFRVINELSSGERQRVMLARVLAQESEVLLLDEPVSHLDPRYQVLMLKLIRGLTKDRKLVTIASLHDINLALRFSDKVILMKNGRIFAMGTPEEVITAENISKVYGVKAVVIKNPHPVVLIEDVIEGESL